MTTDPRRKVYEDVGVRPVINCTGHGTIVGGATISPTAWEAMANANHYYVDMRELFRSTGEIIASLVRAEAAFVTSGGAAALNLGAAACITGDNPENIQRMPDSEGMKNEVIIQTRMLTQMAYGYWRCFETAGGTNVYVGTEESATVEDMEKAITDKTAIIHYLGRGPKRGGVPPLADVIALGKKYDIPIFVDAAGETWPVDGLTKFTEAGADLVAYASKYFNGPHSAGILCGRKDLVDIAFKHSFIGFQYGTLGVGRGYKLERGTVIGVVHALREWLTTDHEPRLMAEDRMVNEIASAVKDIPGVQVTRFARAMTGVGAPISDVGGPAGSVAILIDSQVVGKTAPEVAQDLRDSNPSIWVAAQKAGAGAGESMGAPDVVGLTMICMEEYQAAEVAEKIRAALTKK